MLNAITLESLGGAVVHMDRERHRHRPFRIHQPIAVVLIDVQVIRDDLKLVASHLENFVMVDSHRQRKPRPERPGRKLELLALG